MIGKAFILDVVTSHFCHCRW